MYGERLLGQKQAKQNREKKNCKQQEGKDDPSSKENIINRNRPLDDTAIIIYLWP